jgi:hypothetical protein
MKFSHLNRRTHLYLAMALLPWIFMYGLSSGVFAHAPYLNRVLDDGAPLFTKNFERSYDAAVPEGTDLRQIGAQIMRDSGYSGTYGVNRQGKNKVVVGIQTFLKPARLTYSIAEKRLLAEDGRLRWDRLLINLHLRGGFNQSSVLASTWGVVVDIVCLAFLIWVASGIYMWWGLRPLRMWGVIALAGGVGTFLLFVILL